MTWEEAAALPLAALTAWRGLFTQGALKAGDILLVPGIGGGVALFALQFGIAVGAKGTHSLVFMASQSGRVSTC